jgi:hypothetical protein
VEVQLHTFITSALDEVNDRLPCPRRRSLQYPLYRRLGRPNYGEEKKLLAFRESKTDSWLV